MRWVTKTLHPSTPLCHIVEPIVTHQGKKKKKSFPTTLGLVVQFMQFNWNLDIQHSPHVHKAHASTRIPVST